MASENSNSAPKTGLLTLSGLLTKGLFVTPPITLKRVSSFAFVLVI
ncbi:MAG: hypothetical protein R2816_03840 [Flavobacteriaceae bacterium]